MREIMIQETDLISGGCQCICYVQEGTYSINGWAPGKMQVHRAGKADNTLQCTQSCHQQFGRVPNAQGIISSSNTVTTSCN